MNGLIRVYLDDILTETLNQLNRPNWVGWYYNHSTFGPNVQFYYCNTSECPIEVSYNFTVESLFALPQVMKVDIFPFETKIDVMELFRNDNNQLSGYDNIQRHLDHLSPQVGRVLRLDNVDWKTIHSKPTERDRRYDREVRSYFPNYDKISALRDEIALLVNSSLTEKFNQCFPLHSIFLSSPPEHHPNDPAKVKVLIACYKSLLQYDVNFQKTRELEEYLQQLNSK